MAHTVKFEDVTYTLTKPSTTCFGCAFDRDPIGCLDAGDTCLITRTHVYEVAADQDELIRLEPLTETENPPEIGHERSQG